VRGEVLKHFSRDLCTTSCSFFVRLEDFAQGGMGILPVRTATIWLRVRRVVPLFRKFSAGRKDWYFGIWNFGWGRMAALR